MQQANITLALGGSRENTVPKYGVTPGEIMVLRGIHGPDAVFDIEPLDEELDISAADDKRRLMHLYRNARDHDNQVIAAVMFPGAGSRVPETLDDIEPPLMDDHYKAATRVAPKKPTKASKPKSTPKAEPKTEPKTESTAGVME